MCQCQAAWPSAQDHVTGEKRTSGVGKLGLSFRQRAPRRSSCFRNRVGFASLWLLIILRLSDLLKLAHADAHLSRDAESHSSPPPGRLLRGWAAMAAALEQSAASKIGVVPASRNITCERYWVFRGETLLNNGLRTFLYFLGIAYCFLGLSAITARFFKSMENVVKHTRKVAESDPETNSKVYRYEKVWNYTIADITLMAFGTSFPQISLAAIDAVRNLGNRYAGGLGPGTLVGSAAFDLFVIHAICVVMPKAGELKKISDIGVWVVELFWSLWAYIWLYIILEVWSPEVVTFQEALLTFLQFGVLLTHAYAQDKRWPYLSLPISRSERPEDWVPEECASSEAENNECVEDSDLVDAGDYENTKTADNFSVRPFNITGPMHSKTPESENAAESTCKFCLCVLWKEQFLDAFKLETPKSRRSDMYIRLPSLILQILLAPWRILFAFVPPYQIAHGWVAFVCSLVFITGIAYVVTHLTDLLSCVTGLDPYVIAFTAVASGVSWPDLVASKIAAERQITADSAIANITCSNSVNIYVGIGIPWLIGTTYNFFKYGEPLWIHDVGGLSFSLIVFFATSVGCIGVLIIRRVTVGAELGGPRLWGWLTCLFFMILWLIFVVLSSLKVSRVI